MNYDAKARIQTGPGLPQWTWRSVSFGWNGPVTAAQQVRAVLIPSRVERAITALRVALLLLLAGVLLGARRLRASLFRGSAKAAAVLAFLCLACQATAQSPIPDKTTLEQLRQRLLAPSDAYPHAAEIPSVALTLHGRKMLLDAEIHASLRVAVPLPGHLPAWSPISVQIDGQPAVSVRRSDGYLWVFIDAGVHHVHLEGSLGNLTDWEWTYLLKPRHVNIEAPDWTVSGLKPDGVPEAQLLLSRKQKAKPDPANDEQVTQNLVLVERRLEFGPVWQVHTTVTRLTPAGRTVALRLPLLPGENVLSAQSGVKDGFLEIRLGAQER